MGSIINQKLKHTLNQKIQNLTVIMYTFEPQNMFSMVNTMMNDPEFKKLAQNFEDQMKNTMEEMKKAKTSESQKSTENTNSSSSSKTTEKSCSSPKTQNCSKTQNSSACPMFTTRMCNPRKNNQKSSSTTVSIPLKRFTPEQVQLNMNKNGLATATASRENTEESNRNGQRKTTIMIEETCQLPGYLVDNDLLKTVESKFHDGFLVLSYAEDPKVVEEREAEERKHAPIEIPIMMED